MNTTYLSVNTVLEIIRCKGLTVCLQGIAKAQDAAAEAELAARLGHRHTPSAGSRALREVTA